MKKLLLLSAIFVFLLAQAATAQPPQWSHSKSHRWRGGERRERRVERQWSVSYVHRPWGPSWYSTDPVWTPGFYEPEPVWVPIRYSPVYEPPPVYVRPYYEPGIRFSFGQTRHSRRHNTFWEVSIGTRPR